VSPTVPNPIAPPSTPHLSALITPPSTQPIKPTSVMPSITTSSNSMVTRSKNNIHKPKQHLSFLAHSPSPETPYSYKQAQGEPHWNVFMQAKFDALVRNHMWTLIPNDPSKREVNCKWLFAFRIILMALYKYKARLVAKCFTQRSGLDYYSTFSHVVRPTVIRLVLAIVVLCNWCLHQLGVPNAFLQGVIILELHAFV